MLFNGSLNYPALGWCHIRELPDWLQEVRKPRKSRSDKRTQDAHRLRSQSCSLQSRKKAVHSPLLSFHCHLNPTWHVWAKSQTPLPWIYSSATQRGHFTSILAPPLPPNEATAHVHVLYNPQAPRPNSTSLCHSAIVNLLYVQKCLNPKLKGQVHIYVCQ